MQSQHKPLMFIFIELCTCKTHVPMLKYVLTTFKALGYLLHAKSKLQQLFSLVLVSLDLSHTRLVIVTSSTVTIDLSQIYHELSHFCIVT